MWAAADCGLGETSSAAFLDDLPPRLVAGKGVLSSSVLSSTTSSFFFPPRPLLATGVGLGVASSADSSVESPSPGSKETLESWLAPEASEKMSSSPEEAEATSKTSLGLDLEGTTTSSSVSEGPTTSEDEDFLDPV